MPLFAETAVVLVIAYLLGSIPTALIVSTRARDVDIRTIGDGNMGARNVFHEIGLRHGIIVGLVDFSKGALSILIAHALGLSLGWQIMAGIAAILGHDFSVFSGFKGGLGTATSIGTMLVLFPVPAIVGLITYGVMFLIIKNFSMSGNIGGVVGGLMLAASHQWMLLGYAATIYMLIHIKVLIDNPRRMAIEPQNGNKH